MSRTDERTVRVAAWNVLCGSWGTPEQFAETLRPYDPDIIGLNETPQGDFTAGVAAALGMPYHVIGTLSSGGEQHEWGRDKYKAVVSKYPLGPPTDVYPIDPSDWLNGSATRTVADVDGVPVAVYSLHIPGGVVENSVAEALGRHIAASEPVEYVVAMGDYNDSPGAPGLVAFEAQGMRSWAADLGLDDGNTFTSAMSETYPDGRAFKDQIHYRPAESVRAIDGGAITMDPKLSDHKPVWGVIRFRPRSCADGE